MDAPALQIARGGLIGSQKAIEKLSNAALAFVLASHAFLIGPLGLDLLQSGINANCVHDRALPAGC